MMKKMLMVVVGLIVFAVSPALAADQGTTGAAAPVLRYGVGARAAGMGDAYIAIVDDATATYWNPAGLSLADRPMINMMHSAMFVGTNYDYIGWSTPAGAGNWGISYLSLVTPGILNTHGTDTNASTNVLYGGYGWKWHSWRFGVTGKYIQEDLLGATGGGVGVDAGLQADLTDHYQLGLVIRDALGTRINWESSPTEEVPRNYRLGLAYHREALLMVAEYEKADQLLTTHFGVEYQLNDFLKIRGGMKNNDLTAGIGITKDGWQFDYAFCAGDLENTQRLSLTVKLK